MWRRDSSGWRERQPYDPDRSAGSLRGVGERHEATAPRATEAGLGDATASDATSFCSLCLFYPNSHAGASAWPFAAASACAFLSPLSVVLSVACAVVALFALHVAIAACFRRRLLPGSHRWRFSARGCCRPHPRRGLSPGPRRRRRRRRPFLFPVAVLRPLAAPVQQQEVVVPAANVITLRVEAPPCVQVAAFSPLSMVATIRIHSLPTFGRNGRQCLITCWVAETDGYNAQLSAIPHSTGRRIFFAGVQEEPSVGSPTPAMAPFRRLRRPQPVPWPVLAWHE